MLDKGIVCLTQNADVSFDFEHPYACNKVGEPVSNNWWCYGINFEPGLPDCNVAECCALHLGSTAYDYNPLSGLNKPNSEEYYVCCNGGSEELFGCLDSNAINYDENAMWDPIATGETPFASCIYPHSAEAVVIKTDDGNRQYEEEFIFKIVAWRDSPIIDDPFEISLDEDTYIDFNLRDIVISPTDINPCNNQIYKDDCLMFEICHTDNMVWADGTNTSCIAPSNGTLDFGYNVFDAPDEETSWGVYSNIRYIPGPNYFGTDQFNFRVSDLSVTPYTYTEGTININVIGIPDQFTVYEYELNQNPLRVDGYDPSGVINFKNLSGFVTDPDVLVDPKCLPNDDEFYSGTVYEPYSEPADGLSANMCTGDCLDYCDYVQSFCNSSGFCEDHSKLCSSDGECSGIHNGLCQYSLNQSGLFCLGYKIKFEGEGENILVPKERINGVVFQSTQQVYNELETFYKANISDPLEFVIVGTRDLDNNCCFQYIDSIYQPECILGLQTRFHIDNMWKGTENTLPQAVQLMTGGTTDYIFERHTHHQSGTYKYSKLADLYTPDNKHKHYLNIEYGGDCSAWTDTDIDCINPDYSCDCTDEDTVMITGIDEASCAEIECEDDSTGVFTTATYPYLDLSTTGNITTLPQDVLYISFDYRVEFGSVYATIIPYPNGYKAPNASTTETVTWISDEGVGYDWRRATWRIDVEHGGDIHIRFGFMGATTGGSLLQTLGIGTSTDASKLVPYTILLDNFKLELNAEPTQYVENYTKSDILEAHFKEYLMNVKIQNSWMQFCISDELLITPEYGLGGGTYDLKFIDQHGQTNIETNVGRKIQGQASTGYDPLIPNIARTKDHISHGYISGLLLEPGSGPWDTGNDLSLSTELLKTFFVENQSLFDGSFSRSDRGSIFLMGCKSGFTLMSPKFYATNNNDFYLSGIVSDAYGHHLEENGKLMTSNYFSAEDYGPSIGTTWKFGDVDHSSAGLGHGFKIGEEIGIFWYSGVTSGDTSRSCPECVYYILGSGDYSDPGNPDAWAWNPMINLSAQNDELFTSPDSALSTYQNRNFGLACSNSHWSSTDGTFNSPWHGGNQSGNPSYNMKLTVKNSGFYNSGFDNSILQENIDINDQIKISTISEDLYNIFNIQTSNSDYLQLYNNPESFIDILAKSVDIDLLDNNIYSDYIVPDIYRDVELTATIYKDSLHWQHIASELYEIENYYYNNPDIIDNTDEDILGGFKFYVDNIQKSLGTYAWITVIEQLNNYLADSEYGINYNHHSKHELVATSSISQSIGTGGIDILTGVYPESTSVNQWSWNNSGWPMRGGWALRTINTEVDIPDITKDSLGNYKLKAGEYVFSTHLYIPEEILDKYNPTISLQYRQSTNNTDWNSTYTEIAESLTSVSTYKNDCDTISTENVCRETTCTWSDSAQTCFSGWQRISGSLQVYSAGSCIGNTNDFGIVCDTLGIPDGFVGCEDTNGATGDCEWIHNNADYVKIRINTDISDCASVVNLLEYSNTLSNPIWETQNIDTITTADNDYDDDSYIDSDGNRNAWQISNTAANGTIKQVLDNKWRVAAQESGNASTSTWEEYNGSLVGSIYLRGTGTVTLGLKEDGGAQASVSTDIVLSTTWERYQTPVANWTNNIYAPIFEIDNLSSAEGEVIYLYHPQVEIGSVTSSFAEKYRSKSCNGTVNCEYTNSKNYCNDILPSKDLVDTAIFTFGGQLEYRSDNNTSAYQLQSDQSENRVKLPIRVTGINPPIFYQVNYVAEAITNEGIQNGMLTHANGASDAIYNWTNIGQDIISYSYLNQTFDINGSTTIPHTDPDFGIKSMGSIDFSTWVYEAAFSDAVIQVKRDDGVVETISDTFVHSQENIWDNIVTAINNGRACAADEDCTRYTPYTATLLDASGGNPLSNLKTIKIEAREVGKQFDGDLLWTVPMAVVGTRMEGDISVAAQPTFNKLVKGDAYPVLHVYEDFDSITLEVSGSDVDGGEAMSFGVFPANINIVSASISGLENFHYTTPNEASTKVLLPHPIGESIAVGGNSDVPDWIDTGEVQYCTDGISNNDQECTENDSEWVISNLGETRTTAVVKIIGQTRTCNLETGDKCNTNTGYNDYDACYTEVSEDDGTITCIPNKILEANYVGQSDIVVKMYDKVLTTDIVNVRLVIHPVNDPPLIAVVSDTSVYMNNPNYPTDINLELKAWDIEKDNPVWQEVEVVNTTYCTALETLVTDITSSIGQDIVSRLDCTVAGFAEYSCSMANFNPDDSENISQDDIDACFTIADTAVPLTASFTNNPKWMKNLDTFVEDLGPFKQYVNIIPQENRYGTGAVRVSATDQGLNEDGTFTEIRTGFETIIVNVDPVATTGPDGQVVALELSSLGARPDAYEYSVKGEDDREKIPTEITKNFQFLAYSYHPMSFGNETRVLDDCGAVPYENNVGFRNEFGECCSSNTVEISNFIEDHFDETTPYYYKQDFIDETNLLLSYLKPTGPDMGPYCHVENDFSRLVFSYKNYFDSNNVDGYLAPNSLLNELDYVVSYYVEIIDIVPNYLTWPGELTCDDATCANITGGSDQAYCIHGECIFTPDEWWKLYFDGDTCEGTECEDGKFWVPFFQALDLEWNIDMCPGEDPTDIDGSAYEDGALCTPGDNPNYGKVLFRMGPFSQENNNLQKIIVDGFTYKYDYPSFFNVLVHATDTYGFTNHDDNLVDATTLIKLKQTLLHQFSPWQGMNITGTEPVENSYISILDRDIDNRPPLGLFYYDELNKWGDWSVKYGNSYIGEENADVNPGGWSKNYPGEYFNGEAINKLQYSELFDNLKIYYWPRLWWYFPFNIEQLEAMLEQTAEEGTDLAKWLRAANILYACVDIHGLDIYKPISKFYGEHVCHDMFVELADGNLTDEDRDGFINELLTHTNTFRKLYSNGSTVYGKWKGDTGITIESTDNVAPDETNKAYQILAKNTIHPLTQKVTIEDRAEMDRIFSIFIKNIDADKTTLKVKYKGDETTGWTTVATTYTIDWSSTFDSNTAMYNMEDFPYGTADGQPAGQSTYPYFKVINEIEQNAPMWYYTDVGNDWYQFSVRAEALLSDIEFDVEIYPSGDATDSTNLGSIQIWGTQVQEIEPHEVKVIPYQKTRDLGEVGVYDFIPDVDVRTFLSTEDSGYKSVLYQYYDEVLQPGEFLETAAPTEAQFYFYIRDPFEEALFTPKMELDFIPNTLYVGFIDWGDGSTIEYDDEPFRLTRSTILRHVYEKSGIYEIKGEMFNIALNTNNISLGIGNFKQFIVRININSNPDIESNFSVLGGNPTYYPYHNTTPVISGISKYSAYYKIVKQYAGNIKAGDMRVDLQFAFYGDELGTELALARIDENFVGPEVSAFTGSYASESIVGLNPSDVIELYSGTGDIESTASESFFPEYNNQFIRTRGFYNCQPYPDCITMSGSAGEINWWDATTGHITGSLDNPPIMINRGIGTNFGELGNYLGSTDISHIGYFQTGSIQLWQLLGFEDVDAGNPSKPRFWNNIIPEGTWIGARSGVSDDLANGIDEGDPQTWDEVDGVVPYYPVLPKLNQDGTWIDDVYQGPGNIPFGDREKWDDVDNYAPITANVLPPEFIDKAAINITFSNVEENIASDDSGNGNLGIFINDYIINYKPITLEASSVRSNITLKVNKNINKKAF